MDPELQKLMRENFKLTEENNRLLRKMHRATIWARILRIVYWVILIGLALGAYYILQPVFTEFLDAYESLRAGIDTVKGIGSSIPFPGN